MTAAQPQDFDSIISQIIKRDPRYGRGAYHFVREALDYTMKHSSAKGGGIQNRHITAENLLEGIRDYAILQYGPMAKALFDYWNVRTCEDFGRIVFALVESGVFGKTAEDRIEDFQNGYDFREAFVEPFLPREL